MRFGHFFNNERSTTRWFARRFVKKLLNRAFLSSPQSMNHKTWTELYHPIDTINNNNPPLVVAVRQVATAEAEEAAAVVDIIIIVRAAVEEVGGDIIRIDVTITAVDGTLDGIIGIIIMKEEDIMAVVVVGEDIKGVVDVMAVADDVSFCLCFINSLVLGQTKLIAHTHSCCSPPLTLSICS